MLYGVYFWTICHRVLNSSLIHIYSVNHSSSDAKTHIYNVVKYLNKEAITLNVSTASAAYINEPEPKLDSMHWNPKQLKLGAINPK